MNSGQTVELVIFKLKAGADEQAFLRASDAIMPNLRTFPGYLHRELLKGQDGQWIDMVHWRSYADAISAAETFMTMPCAQELGNFLDESTMTMLHPEQARVYSN